MSKIFGSLINLLAADVRNSSLEIGIGGTILHWSDRTPVTVTCIYTDKKIGVTPDKATRIDNNGMSELQEYTYEPDETAVEEIFTLRKDGRWKGIKNTYPILILGYREKYYDYSF